MISWPNWRRRMPARASSGSAAIRPKMLRVAGSLSKPSMKSGALRWKKLRAWDWRIWPRFIRRRSFSAAGGMLTARICVARLGRGQEVADRADPADAGGDPGHLVERAALAEPLEAAELGDVELGVGHLSGVVEIDGDLGVAFDARDGVDDNPLSHRRIRLRVCVSRRRRFPLRVGRHLPRFQVTARQYGLLARQDLLQDGPDAVGRRRAAGQEGVHRARPRARACTRSRRTGTMPGSAGNLGGDVRALEIGAAEDGLRRAERVPHGGDVAGDGAIAERDQVLRPLADLAG